MIKWCSLIIVYIAKAKEINSPKNVSALPSLLFTIVKGLLAHEGIKKHGTYTQQNTIQF